MDIGKTEVQSVSRALKLLNAFTVEKPNYTLQELSQHLGFYKSTILRLANTLIKWGYLRRSNAGIFSLGSQVFILGQVYYTSIDLVKIVEPILKETAAESQETTAVWIIDNFNRLCLTSVPSPQRIRDSNEPGRRVPIHTGASGKVLLAFCKDEAFYKKFKKTSLISLTPKTITAHKKLEEKFEKIRSVGYDVNLGETDENAAAVAVPLWGTDETLLAALTLSGPKMRFTRENRKLFLKILWDKGEQTSALLGYHGNFWKRKIDFSSI
jgi:DNA-binding IclR family transcriptional regulator